MREFLGKKIAMMRGLLHKTKKIQTKTTRKKYNYYSNMNFIAFVYF